MDRNRFDLLTRHLSTIGNRRRALLTLAAGGLGLGVLTGDDAGSKRKKKRKRKKERCNTLGQACTPDCQASCCAGLMCAIRIPNTPYECCVPTGSICDSDGECCAGTCTLMDGAKRCYLAPPQP